MAQTQDGPEKGAGAVRRDFLELVAWSTLGVGTLVSLWPFVDSLNPSADVLALASTELDLAPIEEGQRVTVKWRGKPVFVDHRTPQEIEAARATPLSELRDPEPDEARVQRPEWLVVIGICTHLGCVPLGNRPGEPRGEWGGWFCPCHGSHYDTSGRIRKGPAPRNLHVPPYTFVDNTLLRIG
ncbi:Ubiquinol-cytochrome c reductase iron-sulfur subunit [bacterium HR40]|nr:Ubiquinol-cytochrome c reductase iron-sulfur subunit [bacterium HR40]